MYFRRLPFFLCLLLTFQINCMKRTATFALRNGRTLFSSSMPRSFASKRLLHFDHLKHLYNGLSDEARPYSPVHAAALVESGWLKKLYEFGNKKDSTVQLLNDEKMGLFFLRDNQFRPTQNKSNPCYSLTPSLIGTIIGSLKSEQFNDPVFKAELVKTWRAEHKKTTGDSGSIAKINAILDTIDASVSESKDPDSLYLPYTTESMLLSYLYRKASDKEEMISYLESLNKYVPTFNGQNYRDRLVIDHYTPEEQEEYNQPPDDWRMQAFLDKHLGKYYEQTLCRTIQKLFKKPPHVMQGSYAFGKNTEPRPDCFETSMRGIFNRLLVNKKDTSFDLSMLPTSLNPRTELIKFYTEYAGFDTVNNVKNPTLIPAGQAWMNLVSDIPLIDYICKNYEIRSSTKNMIHLFNHLLNCNATTVEELGATLSDNRRTITFKAAKDIAEYDNNNEITITIKEGHQLEQLILNITPGHTYLSKPQQEKTADDIAPIPLSQVFLYPDRDFGNGYTLTKNMNHNVAYLATLQPTISRLNLQTPNNIAYHYALSLPLEDPNTVLILIGELLYSKTNSSRPKSSAFLDLAFSLIQRMPHDTHYASRLIIKIIENKTHLHDQRFEEYIKKQDAHTLNLALESLIEGTNQIVPSGLIQLLQLLQQNNFELSYKNALKLAYRFKYGENEVLDTFIFKGLLPLKKNHIFSLTAQEQEVLLIKIFPQFRTFQRTLNARIIDSLGDRYNQRNTYSSYYPENLLEYTFLMGHLSEFIELLEAGADPDKTINTILIEVSHGLPRAQDFLKSLLVFKPTVDSFKLNLKYCTEEIFELFLEAGYSKDSEFVKNIFKSEDPKKIEMLCSKGIDMNLQQELLYKYYKKLYNTNGWSLELFQQRRKARKMISLLKYHDATLTPGQQEELRALKKNENYSWLQNIL